MPAIPARLAVAFAVIVSLSSAAYLQVMFDGAMTPASVIEALNYSAQTVTSVGYGNWVPTQWKEADAGFHHRILIMKAISVPFCLLGAGFFAFAVGVLTNYVWDQTTD
jgi:hypothetical protein